MRVASVCSGIGGAELAFHGIAAHAFAAETDPFARAVLAHRFPDLKVHHDLTQIPASAGPVDVLAGGTPCQSFSIAGLRGGMADERGNLALEFLRLAERLRARWVLWENVPGVLSSNNGRDFGAFIGGLAELGYGWAYRSLDAQYFGLAQRRKRVFVVGYLGDWRRAAAVLFEPASLRGHPAPSREARERAAPTLNAGPTSGGRTYGKCADTAEGLIPYDILGTPATRGAVQTDLHTALRSRAPGASEASTTTVIADSLRSHPRPGSNSVGALAFGGNNTAGSIDIATAVNAHGGTHGRLDFESETFVTHSLRADGFDASEDGTGRGTPLVAFNHLMGAKAGSIGLQEEQAITVGTRTGGGAIAFDARQSDTITYGDMSGPLDSNNGSRRRNGVATASSVRRLTPRECERLQGFPDGWTDVVYRGKAAADGPRYRALGNAFAIPVVRWIARRLVREDVLALAPADVAA